MDYGGHSILRQTLLVTLRRIQHEVHTLIVQEKYMDEDYLNVEVPLELC